MSDTLLLIDGNNLAYRCRYTFQLSNRGQDVSVTYGFLRVLESLLKKHKPSAVIVAWDGRVPKFRRQLVPEYKVGRHVDEDPEVREDFNRQMDELHTYALPRMGILSVKRSHTEADDLLYQAAIISLHETNIIVTGDKDLLQSISDHTYVYSPNKEKLYNVQKFEEEFGIPLSRFVWWKAVQGDGSDNIPGVKGIGEVTASKLINTYANFDEMFNAISNNTFTGKAAKLLTEFGYDRIMKNFEVMNLSIDRTGARYSLLEEVKFYRGADKKMIKNYFLRNAYVSLLDSLPMIVSNLQIPKFDTQQRYPIVVERTPLEDI